ncbi:uncharacterized protein [Montipora capricornis]|uniref:uncharacterized protein n=1 Tax=Montipora capricornis TaxID=246305 RepID=UPI0035F187C2
MRFRENQVAISGDISKMYHRILIPEEDQHVHRFLWRSMEIDRKPDTYVKTILTFGDKPAPAMAQIALRKTAAEGENHSPSAAKTLKENSYMDEILDSVQTVSEACEWTKRSILSQIARIYDPVGFAAAFLIRAKIGFQELWQQGYEWDQDLPSAVQQKWLSLFKEMKELNEVSFPRSLSPPEPADSQPTLCVFADTSQDAFGTCAYIRWTVEKDKFDIRLIAAKSRVAPLKKITIPWLQLQAAVLASRLQATIKEESRFQFKETVIFTDSAIVLAWVRGKIRRYKPFVSSRIGEIQSQTDPAQ